MDASGYALFATPIGRCGLAWSERGVAGCQLPERTPAAARARLLRRLSDIGESLEPARESEPGSQPDHIRAAIRAISELLEGQPRDLSFILLDLHGVPDFARRVYDAARLIPAGETLTYGELARKLGAPGAARAVGRALGQNPYAPIVPCHRVLAAHGGIGGFSASGGVRTKWRMLEIERAACSQQLALPLE